MNKNRKTRKIKGGGKGTPFNMSNMLSALENTKTKVKTKHLYTKKKTTKFSKKNYMNVVKTKKTKKTKIPIEEKSEKMFSGLKQLENLYDKYNKKGNETLSNYYGSIEQELRDKFSLITGDEVVSDTPFEFLLSIEDDNHSNETLNTLYKTFISILNDFHKEKNSILIDLKDAMANKPLVKNAGDELASLFAGMGI
jgi:hypothetical protein